MKSPLAVPPLLSLPVLAAGMLIPSAAGLRAAPDFQREVLPLLTQYCNDCHSTEEQKGDLDLERFRTPALVKQHPGVWEHVLEQMANNEMPPKNKPQLPPDQKRLLTDWVRSTLDEAALESAGDPGLVVLRRLSNAEYTYTVRDLTGVDSLDPAQEFPVDGASGEGFTNAGAGLVMSPSLVTKYFDAAKGIAGHAVLLPDGIRFSPHTSQRDWTDESLAAIRGFYSRWTVQGGGSAVNLQGIKFDTADGGVLPLEQYLAATLAEREALLSGTRSLADAAAAHGLNAKYLGALWAALNGSAPSFLLDQLRHRWRAAGPGDAPALMAHITPWQQALWRFTQVGQIGKRDSAKTWQVPVGLLEEAREIRLKLPPPAAAASTSAPDGEGAVSVFLSVSDAGDGGADDLALWENPRLVIPGRPDLPLRDAAAAARALSDQRETLFSQAARSLSAAASAVAEPARLRDPEALARLAADHRVDPQALETWLRALGLNAGEATIDSHLTQRLESAENYSFVKGWTGPDALGVLANPTDNPVRVPGLIKAHGLSMHPAPNRAVVAGWRSPVAGMLKVEAVVQDAHTACGNGFTWAVQLRQGASRRQLASGIVDGAEPVTSGPLENISVRPGDVLALVIGPRDGSHVCDMTSVDLTITDGVHAWDMAKEVSPDILSGNPHADAAGNAGVWHFFSEPDNGAPQEAVVPPGSLLARWYEAGAPEEKNRLAEEFQKLLLTGSAGLPAESPDTLLHRRLASVNGPLLGGLLRRIGTPAAPLPPAPEDSPWGLKPSLFGSAAGGVETAPSSLCVQAPSVLEVRLPADLLAAGAELAATARLHPAAGPEGSVQMRILTTRPAAADGPVAELPRELGAKTKWSDGEMSVAAGSPILARRDSAAWTRLDRACGEFRDLFPAALCYTKIVPVDEVVTLTLFYREDDQLKRLLLDDALAAELDRLWDRLHYVSQDALKLVDAYEQLYQFATQDADPSAFAELREPILQRAEAFKKQVAATRPAHLKAVLELAENAWRRPLTDAEDEQLRALYQRLLAEGIPHEDAIRLTLARVLVAPAFLYRGEHAPAGLLAGAVSDWELATRLSYFLTSSAPDAELRALAAAGALRRPEVLKAQTRRLTRGPGARRLATEFGCQWLHVRDVETLDEKSERHFPTFVSLRSAMQEEVVRFFMDLFQEDRPVLSLLTADHTFVNGALAGHYGLEAGGAADWHRVEGMRAHGRGGILGFAATLSKQSGASRTSPILRGNWLNEVVLGDRLPRPPKGIPVLPEETLPGLTERQLIERHSSDANCARCHQRIDPFGFALEGFDAIGRLRRQDAAGLAIDTATTLPDGTPLAGLDGLRDYLLHSRRDDFLRQFCHKLLGYALGRGVQLSDKPLLEAMTAALKSGDGRVGQALDLIVTSPQFLQIRGRDFPIAGH